MRPADQVAALVTRGAGIGSATLYVHSDNLGSMDVLTDGHKGAYEG